MNWLIIHNRFKNETGEEIYLHKFIKLLESNDVTVKKYLIYKNYSFFNKFRFILTQNFNLILLFKISRLIKKHKINVVNIHNPYPFVGHTITLLKSFFPNVIFTQTIHNYRHFCANGLFFNGKKVCFDCVEKNISYSIINRCKENIIVNLSFFLRLFFDNLLGLKWNYDFYFVLNKFQESLFSKKVSYDRILKINNFISDKKNYSNKKIYDYAFIGRVDDFQKGFDNFYILAKNNPNKSFIVMGGKSNNNFKKLKNLKFLGYLNKPMLLDNLSKTKFLICTSRSYEVFPNVILEAWLCKTIPIVPSFPTYSDIVGKYGFIYSNIKDIMNLNFTYSKINFKNALEGYNKASILRTLNDKNLI